MEFRNAKDWDWVFNTNKALANLKANAITTLVEDSFVQCGPLLPIRALFHIRSQNKIEELQRTLYYDTLQSAEESVAGSSVFLSDFLLEEIAFEKGLPKKRGFSEYVDYVCSLMRDRKTVKVFRQACLELSADSRIVLRKGKKREPTIEIRQSYKIEATVDPLFSRMVGENFIALDFCKVFAIEGSIASISEIHGMLEKFSEDMTPCVLLCQNFSEEVANTLAVNWIKRKLMVVPLRYGNSLSNINLLADISVLAGVTPVSKNLGDSISVSCLDSERYGNLINVKISDSHTLAGSTNDVSHHVSDLMRRMSLEEVEDKVDIISERISNLCGSILEITVYERDLVCYEELDAAIKILNEFVKFGSMEKEGQMIPYSIYLNCIERSGDLKNKMSSIGGFLYHI